MHLYGATVITGANHLEQERIFSFATDRFNTEQIDLIVRPKMEAILIDSAVLIPNPRERFALRDIVKTQIQKSLQDPRRMCVVLTSTRAHSCELPYDEIKGLAYRERTQIHQWFGDRKFYEYCVTADKDFIEIA